MVASWQPHVKTMIKEDPEQVLHIVSINVGVTGGLIWDWLKRY
jgi:hypothetical protein